MQLHNDAAAFVEARPRALDTCYLLEIVEYDLLTGTLRALSKV
jgi:hypothetical protein